MSEEQEDFLFTAGYTYALGAVALSLGVGTVFGTGFGSITLGALLIAASLGCLLAVLRSTK